MFLSRVRRDEILSHPLSPLSPHPLALPRTSPTPSSPSSSLPHSSPLRLIRALHPGRHHCSLSSLACQAAVKPPRAPCPTLCVLPPRLGDAAAPLNFRRPAQLQCLVWRLVRVLNSAERMAVDNVHGAWWRVCGGAPLISLDCSALPVKRHPSSLHPHSGSSRLRPRSWPHSAIGVFFHWCK